MTWTTAISDVRRILSDGQTDKLRYRKQVLGEQDGVNLVFKTFEMRRISEFVGATPPIGVYLNNVLVTVTSEDLMSGEFTLALPPTDGESLRATYYVQWFLDEELDQFLISAGEFIGVADNYPAIPESLRPAAKEYAAGIAYQKLAAKFAENLAETYQLYDAPDKKRFDPSTNYMNISKEKIKLAFELRDDVYKDRQGRAKAPRTANIYGTVPDVPPNR